MSEPLTPMSVDERLHLGRVAQRDHGLDDEVMRFYSHGVLRLIDDLERVEQEGREDLIAMNRDRQEALERAEKAERERDVLRLDLKAVMTRFCASHRTPGQEPGCAYCAREGLRTEIAALREEAMRHEEQEARICPEDVGIVEYVCALKRERDEARAKLAQLVNATEAFMRMGWETEERPRAKLLEILALAKGDK